MRGDRGTPVTQEAVTYFVQSAGSSTVMPLATRTTYPNTTTAGGQTTTYAYTFTPGTTQIVSQRTTLPTVRLEHARRRRAASGDDARSGLARPHHQGNRPQWKRVVHRLRRRQPLCADLLRLERRHALPHWHERLDH